MPRRALAPIERVTGGLSVTWTLAPETPPASVVALFTESAMAEKRMEAAIDRYARSVAPGVSVATVLHRSRNAAWVWIGPHRTVEATALRRCLS